jgi:sugar lactone lactonase YvrE
VFGLVGGAAYLAAWPVPIDPLPWTPPASPGFSGPYAANEALAAVERLPLDAPGPEDVAVDAEGNVYAGLADGRLVRLPQGGGPLTTVVNTGGRPLGLAFDAGGRLLVADARKGLLRVDLATGALEVLATEHGGRPFGFTDDLDVGADGTVYFTDASDRFGIDDYRLDFLEHRPSGRLLAYRPQAGSVRCLIDGLHFANGVAVSPDQRFVLVVETGRYRIFQHWLAGPKQGTTDLFVENLPAFPDGVSAGASGTFWVACAAPRDPTLDQLLPTPAARKVLVRLPEALLPRKKRYAFVLGLDAAGQVVHNLQDPSPEGFAPVTSVEEVGDHLYLGSLDRSAVGRLIRPGLR